MERNNAIALSGLSASSKFAALNDAVEAAKQRDKAEYAQSLKDHEEELKDLVEAKKLADRILQGEESGYLEVIQETDPFSDISTPGSLISFKLPDKSIIEVTLNVKDQDSVPIEIKSLLQSGKLSIKRCQRELFTSYIRITYAAA